MSGNYTPNFRLALAAFDQIPWDDLVNGNFTTIDAVLATHAAMPNYLGLWANSTAYTPGYTVSDPGDGSIWRCTVAHTSADTPSTFAADRAAGASGKWVDNTPASTASVATVDAKVDANYDQQTRVARGHIYGLETSQDSATVLHINPGDTVDDSDASKVISIATDLYKDITAPWAAGPAGAMGDTITAVANTWYYVFAVIVGGVHDVYIDQDIGHHNAPVGTTAVRRIGTIQLDGSAQIRDFIQLGNWFLWHLPIVDVGTTTLDTSSVAFVLASAPPNINSIVKLRVAATNTVPYQVLISSTLVLALSTSVGIANLRQDAVGGGAVSTEIDVIADYAAEVRAVASVAGTSLNISVVSFQDFRGTISPIT